MGSDGFQVARAMPDSFDVKLHASMCLELKKILDIVNHVLPAIESAQPGCRTGIQELCSLNNAIEKSKLLLQHCAESSKLYLAITGEATLLRCERIRNSLNQSLTQIQNMVPELLAAEIASIIDYLRGAKFLIDPEEEEAGKVMLDLLLLADATAESELEAFQFAAVKLHMSSSKDLLIERRSIRKLLDKFHASDPKKEGILKFFLYLIKKYGKKVSLEADKHQENDNDRIKVLTSNARSEHTASNSGCNNGLTPDAEAQNQPAGADAIPMEFICPISLRLMADPVVIASGITYERVEIEKWFSRGNETCPKTQKRLANFSMVPNSCMKDLISSWCKRHGIDVQHPCSQSDTKKFSSWVPSNCDSISSLINVSAPLLDRKKEEYLLQCGQSNVSFLSSDSRCSSDSCHVMGGVESLRNNDSTKFLWSEDYQRCQSFMDFSQDMYLRFFSELSELPLESQTKAVADVAILLDVHEVTWHLMLSNGFTEALMCFIKNTYDLSDVQAQRTGAQILLAVLTRWRVKVPTLVEDAFQLLTMFLDSKITIEALMIMQVLSCHPKYISNIMPLGVLPSIMHVLRSEEDTEILELAVRIICDLSAHSEARSHILSTQCVSKLVSLLSNRRLTESCIKTMRNFSDAGEGALMIAETSGCISSIVELLDNGSCEEQEHAVVILQSLCMHSSNYRLLVMNEGVIPALCNISLNGTSKGKECSMKLLLVLRELRDSDCFDSSDTKPAACSEPVESIPDYAVKSRPTLKANSSFFGRKFRLFSKTLALS